MSAIILDGKALSEKILKDLKDKVCKLNKKPTLAVILANDNHASKIYVNSKEKKAKQIGFESIVYRFDENVSQKELIDLIKKLNNDSDITAILVQLPLFKHLDEKELIEAINPIKDVDGFHPINVGRLNCGLEPYSICCTPKGIIKLLKEYNIELSGKNALVIGRSNIVGKPVASLLTKENATVTIAHSKTKNIEYYSKNADIIISATGRKNMLTVDMVKENTVVVDVGIIRNEEDKIQGEVDFEKIKDIASYITPVPGGVGPMTIACLMENTYELYLKQSLEENP